MTAVNDGCLGLFYYGESGLTIWPRGIARPVLALEAKRKLSSRVNDSELMYKHAGQIFCEMLGQVCYPEFFDRDPNGYQEVQITNPF